MNNQSKYNENETEDEDDYEIIKNNEVICIDTGIIFNPIEKYYKFPLRNITPVLK